MFARPCQRGPLSASFPPRRLLHTSSRLLGNSSRLTQSSLLRPNAYPTPRYPPSLTGRRGISLTAADLASPRPSRFRNWRNWLCRGSVLVCIVGGYMGYVGLGVLGDQDQANYLLCYLIHVQRVVHSPLYTEHLSRAELSSSSSPSSPPTSSSPTSPSSDSFHSESSSDTSDFDSTSLLLFRTLIQHWLDVPTPAIDSYFTALSSLPPSAGVGPIVRSSLLSIRAHLAKADQRDLGLGSYFTTPPRRGQSGMGMGLGGGRKLGTVRDRDESVDVLENQEDLIKLVVEVADLTNEALGQLNALLELDFDETQGGGERSKRMQLELGLEYEETEGKKGGKAPVPKRKERKEYEDVE